jgi:putative ABC transport system permease protein
MFDLDQMHEVFQSLRRNKLRTLLTGLGVFWAVLMLIVMLGFARGLEAGAARNFGSWARNSCGFWAHSTTKPFAGHQAGRRILFAPDDVPALERVPGVQLVVARHALGGWGTPSRVTYKGKGDSFSIWGDEPAYQRIEALQLQAGRFLNEADMLEARKIAVIGPRVAEALYAPGQDPIGTRILINNVEVTVVGVYAAPQGGGNRWLSGRVFMPRTALLRAFGLGMRFASVAMLIDDSRDAVAIEEDVKALLKRRHRIAPSDPGGFGSFNVAREFGRVQTLFFGIAALAWVVGALTLLAGAIAVGNIMVIAVSERTREIGVRKSLGATPARIMMQVVTEAVLLTGLAGYLGLVAGVGVLEIAGRLVVASAKPDEPGFFGAPELDFGRAVIAATLLTVAGTLAGLWPARVAASVKPVEALAHE